MSVSIAPELTVVCFARADPALSFWRKSKGHEIIDVAFQPTMALGFSVLPLGDDRVIALASSALLVEVLRARGFEAAMIELSQISQIGGGLHCKAQALRHVS